jgi:hypothetical protein
MNNPTGGESGLSTIAVETKDNPNLYCFPLQAITASHAQIVRIDV